MGFDLSALKDAVATHGVVSRILICDVRGSSPREDGTSMLVWQTGQSGTIGGGTLEFQVTAKARQRLAEGNHAPHHARYALGPALGQCCGGTVSVLCETFDAAALERLGGLMTFARPVEETPPRHPAVDRLARQMARNPGGYSDFACVFGWVIETIQAPSRPLWVWGAGHVGRAMVDVLAPLPEFAITWVDTDDARFPVKCPEGVMKTPASTPEEVVRYAPRDAEHLIVTYSHNLDLELCHRLLSHDFAYAGLIGSATKWARFRSRLAALGHSATRIDRITCPIGDPALGKHPQAIAIGVAASLLRRADRDELRKDKRA